MNSSDFIYKLHFRCYHDIILTNYDTAAINNMVPLVSIEPFSNMAIFNNIMRFDIIYIIHTFHSK